MLGFVVDLGGDYNKIRTKYPNDKFTKCYTFNSERKMMGTVIQKPFGYRLHAKGASEIVLAKCDYFLDESGSSLLLNESKKNYLVRNVIEKMASEGLRTICVAYRDFVTSDKLNEHNEQNVQIYNDDLDWSNEKEVISKMTCLCLIGIEDPVRDEVPDAIKKCQTSGVVVRLDKEH